MVWDWNTESFIQITEDLGEEQDRFELGARVSFALLYENVGVLFWDCPGGPVFI
jgi:hypothetical protein